MERDRLDFGRAAALRQRSGGAEGGKRPAFPLAARPLPMVISYAPRHGVGCAIVRGLLGWGG